MGNIVTPWMNQYGVCLRQNITLSSSTSISVTDAQALTTNGQKLFCQAQSGFLGIPSSTWTLATEKFGVPVTNRPVFDPGQEINEYNKAIGEAVPTAGTGYNFQKGIIGPTTEFEFDVDRYTIIPFLMALFQAGSSITNFNITGGTEDPVDLDHTEYLFRFPTAAQGAAITNFLSVFKTLDFPSGEVISDGICTRMRLSGATGEPLKVAFEILGRMYSTHNFSTGFAGASGIADGIVAAGPVSAVQYAEIEPYLWQNVMVAVGYDAALDGVIDSHKVVEADRFELTVTANIVPRRYNKRSPIRYVINGYTLEGSLRIPYAADYVGGSYLARHLTKNETTISPIPIDLFWLGNSSLAKDPGGEISTTEMAVYRNMQADDEATVPEQTDDTGFHQGGDLAINVGAIPRKPTNEDDEETMLNLTFTGANIRSGNALTSRAMQITWLEDALTVGTSYRNYTSRPT